MVTTLARPTTKNNPPAIPSHVTELQFNYGVSCSKYEQLAEKKLAKSSTIIVSGIGCTLKVKRNALAIFPGLTHAAQALETRMLYRGVHGVTHIIFITDKGLFTLDALKWCSDQDVSVCMMDSRGNIVQSLSDCQADAKLRRVQYGANAGKVSRELVKRKIAAQLETLKNHPELPGQTSAIEALSQAIREFDVSPLPTHFYDINWLRAFEGRCADAYFQAWQGLPVKWEATAKKTIPPHWLTVGKRSSPLSHNHGARHAIEPAQAILNYAYSILESECKQALNAVGFDLSAGFLHSDVLHRNSLVYDLMELYRAAVDCLVLKLIASTTFAKGDIMTSATGECQFNPQLSRYIGSVCRLSQTEVDAGAAWLKGVLMSAA